MGVYVIHEYYEMWYGQKVAASGTYPSHQVVYAPSDADALMLARRHYGAYAYAVPLTPEVAREWDVKVCPVCGRPTEDAYYCSIKCKYKAEIEPLGTRG